jgi:hypothetical protein
MFDLISQIIIQNMSGYLGHMLSPFPFISMADLIKISGLLLCTVAVELWVRKCRGKRPADSGSSGRDQ